MAWQTRRFLGVEPVWDAPGVCFLWSSTVVAYHYSLPERLSRIWAAVHAPVAVAAFFYLQRQQQTAVMLPFGLWLLYTGLPGSGAWGLRRQPWIKPLAVALAWTTATTLFPVQTSLWHQTVGLCLMRLPLVFGLALAYDLHDRAEDRAGGLPTLASRLGPRGTFRLIRFCWLLAAVGVVMDTGLYGTAGTLAALAGMGLSAWLLERLFRPAFDASWRKMAIDALLLVQPVVAFAST